jgi:YfiR/HmsC-like
LLGFEMMFKILLAAAVAISQPAALEQQVERLAASFISNFPAYVTWPDRAWRWGGERLYIGIIGRNFLGEAGIAYLQERGYEERRYVVHTLDRYTRDQLQRYQILIVGNLPPDELKKLMKEVEEEPILTVGIGSDFNQKGGIIQMQIAGTAITWQVSFGNAKKAGLQIDPRLVTYGVSM